MSNHFITTKNKKTQHFRLKDDWKNKWLNYETLKNRNDLTISPQVSETTVTSHVAI